MSWAGRGSTARYTLVGRKAPSEPLDRGRLQSRVGVGVRQEKPGVSSINEKLNGTHPEAWDPDSFSDPQLTHRLTQIVSKKAGRISSP